MKFTKMYQIQFAVIDYVIFGLSLCWSMGIGLYFGCFNSKQQSVNEYLYGKGNFKAIPVGISIFSSLVSALTFIGNPSEVYVFGSQLIFGILSAFLTIFFIWIFVLPIFNQSLNIKTPFEYFELRYGKHLRTLLTMFYLCNALIFLPIILYTSCLTMAAVMNLDINICILIAGGMCTIYTLLGGYSSVVWIDVLQGMLMMISYTSIAIVGLIKVGGFQEVWNKAQNGGRLNFVNLDPNPFQRLNTWTVVIGTLCMYVAHMGCSPVSLHRFLSLKTEKQTRISVIAAMLQVKYTLLIGVIIGWLMYAYYEDCDLVKNKTLSNYSQLTVAFSLKMIENLNGMAGLFAAGILSAGLSTISAELNTISGMIYFDFMHKKCKKIDNDKYGSLFMKFVVLIFGIYCLFVAPIMYKIQYLQQILYILSGTLTAFKFTFFIIGSVFPRITSTGAIAGVLTSVTFIAWIAIGATYYDVASLDKLPLSTENCPGNKSTLIKNLTLILNHTNVVEESDPLLIYKLSPLSYIIFNLLISVLISHLVCFITGFNDVNKMDPRLMVPFIRPKKMIQIDNCNLDVIN